MNNKHRKLLITTLNSSILFLLFFVVPINLTAQDNGRIYGRVTNANNQPIQFVTIGVLNNNALSTTTDNHGKYSITVPSKKEMILVFHCIGFQAQKIVINLKPSETKELNIKLKDTANLLQEVNITDTRSRTENIIRLDPRNSNVIPSPSGGVEAQVKTLPGVHSNNELSSQYSVRGGNYDENLVYVNDIEIYRPFLVRSGEQEGLSFINSDLVSSILFSAGGFDVKYGDKMSSALDIQYKKPKEFAGSASASLLGGSLHLEGSADSNRFTYLIGARQKSNQYILNSLQTKGDYRPSFTDVQTLLTYNISKKKHNLF